MEYLLLFSLPKIASKNKELIWQITVDQKLKKQEIYYACIINLKINGYLSQDLLKRK